MEIASRSLIDCPSFEVYKERAGFAKGVMHLSDIMSSVYGISVEADEEIPIERTIPRTGYEPELPAAGRSY